MSKQKTDCNKTSIKKQIKKKKKKKAKVIKEFTVDLPGIIIHSTNPRQFKKITIDYVKHPELFEQTYESLIGDIENKIVQIDIKITSEDLHKLDIGKINEIVSNAYYCKPIIPSIIKERSYRKSKIKPESTVIDAIRIYISEKNPKGSKIIQRFAEELVEEVGING